LSDLEVVVDDRELGVLDRAGHVVVDWLFVYERLGILLAFMFVCGAALRLARFNAHDVEGGANSYFNGFPTPAAAGVIVSIYFIEYKFFILTETFPDRLHQFFTLLVPLSILALSYLMLSNLRYPNFKKAAKLDGNKFGVITALLLFIVVAARFPLMVFSIAFLSYFCVGFLDLSRLLSTATADSAS
ncbi:MAG: phosphatidylcholine/phosphatidylserine synthase, partial [bacterium]